MTPLTYSTKFTLAVVLLPPLIITLWMIGVPGALSPSTFAALAAVLLGLGAVALVSLRNGKATVGIGQVLHATETARTQHARKGD